MKKIFSVLVSIIFMCPVSLADEIEPIFLDTDFAKRITAMADNYDTSDNNTKYLNDDVNKERFLAILEEPNNSQGIILKLEAEEKVIEKNLIEEADKDAIKLYASKMPKILPHDMGLGAEKLFFEFDEGPIENMLIYGAYRGDFAFSFLRNDSYHTNYDLFMAEAGIAGKLRDLPIDYRFSLNFLPIKDVPYWDGMILDNFITISVKEHNKIRIGHTRTANGIEGGQSGYLIPFINRAQISRTIANARALGIKVIGDYKLVDYDIGVFSSDRFFQSFFPGAEFVGSINFKPLGLTDGKYGKVTLGTSFNVGEKDNYYKNIGLYAAYEYKKFKWDFEYAIADGYNGRQLHSSTKKPEGFYTTLYYDLTDKVQLLARYDHFVPDRDTNSKASKEYSLGLNYRIKGDALKLMLNYVYYDNYERRCGSKIFFGTQFII
ncbi:hypothetical protein IJ818_05115 [bacterium]|nr:hypothetical protein [bacterium]